jgi:uncharacterized membrane protein
MARWAGVDFLASLVDLAAQVAAFVSRHAVHAARRLRVANAILLHAAVLFGARFKRARIRALLGLGLGLGLLLAIIAVLAVLAIIAFFPALRALVAVAGSGSQRWYHGQHGTAHGERPDADAEQRGRTRRRVQFFGWLGHGVPRSLYCHRAKCRDISRRE